ncbi:MAG: porin [Caulobacterales bacterium]
MSLQKALFAGASLFALAGAAHAQDVVTTTKSSPTQDPRDARIQALEESLAAIQDQLADLKAGAAADVAEVRRVQSEAPIVDLKNGRPTFATADGNFKVSIRGLFQADAASYLQDSAGAVDNRRAGNSAADGPAAQDLSSGFNFRRARIGLEGTVYKDWNWALTYEAGGSGTESSQLQQAWVEYAGLKFGDTAIRLRGGAYAWITGLEDATNNTDSLFLERPAPAELVRGLAGGDGRSGVGVYANGERWNASAVWTGSLIGNNTTTTPVFDEQSGYLLRADGLLLKSQDLALHVGANLSSIVNPEDTTVPGAAAATRVRLRERPELRVDGARLVDTGNINASSLTAYGAELGLGYKNFLVSGEYFQIDVNRTGSTASDPKFDGWYAQASWVLTGEQRKWNPVTGGFGGVKPEKNFGKGGLGAWEVAARYSTLNLNDNAGADGTSTPSGGIRGGKQDIISAGLNWYPNSVVRFLLDYQYVDVDRLSRGGTQFGDATTDPVGVTPAAGTQIGQDYSVISLRTQVAF